MKVNAGRDRDVVMARPNFCVGDARARIVRRAFRMPDAQVSGGMAF